MKIKVIKLDGSSPGLGAYLMRWILRLIDMNLFGGGIAVLCIAITTRDQRLGDLAAGTTVVKVKGQETTPVFAVEDDYQPTYPEVIQLTDADIDTIQRVIKAHRDSGNSRPGPADCRKGTNNPWRAIGHAPVTVFVYHRTRL